MSQSSSSHCKVFIPGFILAIFKCLQEFHLKCNQILRSIRIGRKFLWNLLQNFLQEFFQYLSFCSLFLDSSRCSPLLLGIPVKALRRFHQEFLLKFIEESSYYSIKLRVLQGIVDLGFLTELVIELELIKKFAPELLQSSLEILQDFLQGISLSCFWES